MPLAVLSIDLEARLAKLQTDLGKAVNLAQGSADRIRGAFASIGVGLGAGLSIAGLKNIVDGVDALNDLKSATGASIENLSALEDVAVRTGASLDTAGDAVIKLNKALNEAAVDPNSQAAEAFKALGLSVKELLALDPAVGLQKVAQAFAGFADNGQKGRFELVLFSKQTKELAKYLEDLGNAGQLNAKVTTAQAEAANKLNNELASLSKNSTDSARAVLNELIPAVNQLFDAAKGNGPGALTEYLAIPLQTIGVLAANVAYVFRGVGTEIGGIAAQAKAVASLDFSGAGRIHEMMREDAAKAREEFDKLERRMMQIGIAAQATYSNEGRKYANERPSLRDLMPKDRPAKRSAGGLGASITGLDESMGDALARLEKTDTARIEKLNAELQSLLNIQASGIGGEKTNEAIRDVRAELLKLDPVAAKAAENVERLKAILAQTPTGKANAMGEQIAFINAQFDAGKIDSIEQWAEAIHVATGTVDDLAEKSKDVADEIGLVFSSAAGQAIANFQNLRSIIKGVAADILQIAVKSTVTDPLQGLIGGALKGFSFADLFRASGGPVSAGSPYIVGERGPELFVPRSSGTVVPNGGMGVTIVQNLQVGAGVSRHEVASAMVAARDSAVVAVYDAARRGRAVPA